MNNINLKIIITCISIITINDILTIYISNIYLFFLVYISELLILMYYTDSFYYLSQHIAYEAVYL